MEGCSSGVRMKDVLAENRSSCAFAWELTAGKKHLFCVANSSLFPTLGETIFATPLLPDPSPSNLTAGAWAS